MHFKYTKGTRIHFLSVYLKEAKWQQVDARCRSPQRLQVNVDVQGKPYIPCPGAGTCPGLCQRPAPLQQWLLPQQHFPLTFKQTAYHFWQQICCYLVTFFFFPLLGQCTQLLKFLNNKHKGNIGLVHVKATADFFFPLLKGNFAKRWAGIINHTLFFNYLLLLLTWQNIKLFISVNL